MSKRIGNWMNRGVVAMTLALVGLSACGKEDNVLSKGDATNYSTHGLNLGSFLEVQGTYGGGCIQRSGAWSVGLNGFSALANAALSVVKKNTACQLTVTAVRIGTEGTNALYAPSTNIDLAGSYLGTGRSFKDDPGNPIAFYANARISPDTTFAVNFSIDVAYSDDPSQVAANKLAQYAVTSGGAQANQVPVPDYTLSLTNGTIQVDADKVVDSVSGNAELADVTVTGENYAIVGPLASAGYADVDAAYLGATPSAIAGANPAIPLSEFNLVGVDLTNGVVRNLIVAHTVNGTTSYQIFTITFSAP